MSRTANIDDYVKGRMPGDSAVAFERSMDQDSALRSEVAAQQMVVDLFNEARNEQIAADVQDARQEYERTETPSADHDFGGSSQGDELPQVSDSMGGGNSAVIKILFECDGIQQEVIEMSYSFKQEIDQIGQPSGRVHAGIIKIKLGLIKANNWFAWMIQSDVKKDGKLVFVNSTGKTMKTLEFEGAYCVSYHCSYNAFSEDQVKESASETLELSFARLKNGGETYDQHFI